MSLFFRTIKVWVLVTVSMGCGSAQATQTLQSLYQAAVNSLAKPSHNQSQVNKHSGELNPLSASVSQWLNGPLELEAQYLPAVSGNSSDEYALSLNFPIKSMDQRQLDAEFKTLADEFGRVSADAKRLAYSGIVRHILWQRIMAEKRFTAIEQKEHVISRYTDIINAKYKAGELSQIALLQWQRESLAFNLEKQQISNQLDDAKARYFALFATLELPQTFLMPVQQADFDLASHPTIKALLLNYQQLTIALKQQSSQNAPWMFKVLARQISSASITENSLGVSLNVPLSYGNTVSAAALAEVFKAQDDNAIALLNAKQALLQQFNDAKQQQHLLALDADVTEQKLQLSKKIIALQESKSSDVSAQVWFQEILELARLYQHRAELETQQLEINAKLNQILGMPL